MSAVQRTSPLSADQLADNFDELHPPLTPSQALLEADRCYFCFDAPCTAACPTAIDIPRFIQQIRSRNPRGAAKTILEENIMGGMCARVCPTEVLCEDQCVRNTHEDKPVEIGLLQRFAVDPVIETGLQFFDRAPGSGKTVAIIGAGPAGLSCAHRLSMLGHSSVVFDARPKPGGLNEYGIAAYKTVDDFAQREVQYICEIGGIELRQGVLGKDLTMAQLRDTYDAVFLGVGLPQTNQINIPGIKAIGVIDAVEYIAKLRQCDDLSMMPVGQNVVVIGGGMTAIDVAVQSRKLGAANVTIAYRGSPERMKASEYEQTVAKHSGVRIRYHLTPQRVITAANLAVGIEMVSTAPDGDGQTEALDADTIFLAVGQRPAWDDLDQLDQLLTMDNDRIVVDRHRRTSIEDVWAGGDCVVGGDDLTVSAVEDGKRAAIAINDFLRTGNHG